MKMRYTTLLEHDIYEWGEGRGIVQIVSPESSSETKLRFSYYENGKFVNRPLTMSPSEDTAERTGEIVETYGESRAHLNCNYRIEPIVSVIDG